MDGINDQNQGQVPAVDPAVPAQPAPNMPAGQPVDPGVNAGLGWNPPAPAEPEVPAVEPVVPAVEPALTPVEAPAPVAPEAPIPDTSVPTQAPTQPAVEPAVQPEAPVAPVADASATPSWDANNTGSGGNTGNQGGAV